MATKARKIPAGGRSGRLHEAITVLQALGFGSKQSNEVAGYSLLALLGLTATQRWGEAEAPLRGSTPIIEFIRKAYRIRYAPNTRETIRDEAVKYFVESGLAIRNPDDPTRPTNSGKTVYQVERNALELFRSFGSPRWNSCLKSYLASRNRIRRELVRGEASFS
ncbi:MAG: restriction endonuclease, partial [Nitrospira sp.]|nr:restriction endonuclease [Nitrospira sp.]